MIVCIMTSDCTHWCLSTVIVYTNINICKINIGQCGHMLTGGWALGDSCGPPAPSHSQCRISEIIIQNAHSRLDRLGERPPLHLGLEAHVVDLQGEAVPVHGSGAGCCAVLELVCCCCWRGAAAGPADLRQPPHCLVTTLVCSYNISMLLASHRHIISIKMPKHKYI